MNWFKQKIRPPAAPEEPWMTKTFVVNDKPTNLRELRGYALDIRDFDAVTSTEVGLAHTVVALVDEVRWLHAQLLDKPQEEV